MHVRNFFKNKVFFKVVYQKALKKLISFFLSNPVPFNRKGYLKQKGPGTSDQLLFSLQNEFKKKILINYIFDQV